MINRWNLSRLSIAGICPDNARINDFPIPPLIHVILAIVRESIILKSAHLTDTIMMLVLKLSSLALQIRQSIINMFENNPRPMHSLSINNNHILFAGLVNISECVISIIV